MNGKQKFAALAAGFVISLVGIALLRFDFGRSPTPMPRDLRSYEGTFRGFSPTDESAVAMGEIEFSFGHGSVKVRMATGHRIDEETISLAYFRPMTKEELSKEFIPGSDAVDMVVGFRSDRTEFPKFFFAPAKKGGPCDQVVVRLGEMADTMGPTILFSPSAVARGDFDKAIGLIEGDYWKGVVPSLANGGKAAAKPTR